MTRHYQLGGQVIEISTIHRTVHTFCWHYRAEKDTVPAFSVQTSQTDIDRERKLYAISNPAEGPSSSVLSDGYLEMFAVYRKIAEQMPFYDTFLAHGSAVAVDGAAYLFTAPSGTGKSTHTRLWRELLGERAVMVNDDKPLIRVTETETTVYGTPWNGKHHLSRNIAVPLRAVCLLERGEENSIKRITKSETLPQLLILQIYRPEHPEALARTLRLLDRMDVAFYRLHCNMDISAAELSYRTMSGTTY